MLVPDDIERCVAFIAVRKTDSSYRLAGTVFFIARPIAFDRSFQYAVTARHVIDGIRDLGCDKVYLRLNSKESGWIMVETPIQGWIPHPDPDQNVDVSVYPILLPDIADHLCYVITHIAHQEFLKREQVGMGEEVFFAGLFVHHYGLDRNVPIVRIGNIAAVPHDAVKTKIGPMRAYLIEARSIGGISGSPVFLNMGLIRMIDGKVKFASGTRRAGNFRLLGLIHGHFRSDKADIDLCIEEDEAKEEKINAGIAIVVPVDQIMEVINQPRIRDAEVLVEAELQKLHLPAMD
jgi:hypothetical protein